MAYTAINDSELYFQVKLHTGTGGSGSLTFDGSEDMQPDMVWSKSRSAALNHTLFDSVRGAGSNKELTPNGAGAEGGAASATWGYLSAFDSDGFTWLAGSTNAENFNTSSATYANWCWKANGAGSSNGDGAQTTTVSVDTTAGFSIVSYTGTGTTTNFGHGLGVKPNVILIKSLASNDWVMNGDFLGSTTWEHKIILNSTAAKATANNFNDQAPTSSVWYLNSGHGTTNASAQAFIAYCFAEKAGYSKFGNYIGNGNTDGPFCFTGFRPAFFMVKNIDSGSEWEIYDNKRIGYNSANYHLNPSDPTAEATLSDRIDFLSNGFKIRAYNSGPLNNTGGGDDYMYMAFAEAPFVNSNGVPCNAR